MKLCNNGHVLVAYEAVFCPMCLGFDEACELRSERDKLAFRLAARETHVSALEEELGTARSKLVQAERELDVARSKLATSEPEAGTAPKPEPAVQTRYACLGCKSILWECEVIWSRLGWSSCPHCTGRFDFPHLVVVPWKPPTTTEGKT